MNTSWKTLSGKNSIKWIPRDKWCVIKTDEFQVAMEKSKKECVNLTKMNELIFALACTAIAFLKVPSFFDEDRYVSERYSQSLVFTWFIESLRNSTCTVYLSGCGLYRNAYQNIRYALESIIRASYFDSSYPDVDFPTKVEIQKEVEDLPKYWGVRLVRKLNVSYKKETIEVVKNEYKKLSRKIHSDPVQFVATAKNFMERSYSAVYVDCSDVTSIYDSMRVLHDVFFLLLLTHFPEIRKQLVKNEEFVKTIKSHNLNLSSKILRI